MRQFLYFSELPKYSLFQFRTKSSLKGRTSASVKLDIAIPYIIQKPHLVRVLEDEIGSGTSYGAISQASLFSLEGVYCSNTLS